MKRLLSIIAEVIDEITSAYKYAEYDFYKGDYIRQYP